MNETTHSPQHTLRDLISAQAGMPLPPDDLMRLLLPLFAQVAALHAQGKVAGLESDEIVLDDAGLLALRRPAGLAPLNGMAALARIQPQAASSLNIIGALERSRPGEGVPETEDLTVQSDPGAPILRPVYLPGPLSWERLAGHHDEITDVFGLGMVLAALACGLDFEEGDDLRQFVAQHHNLFALAERLHPVLAALIVEMTALNRHARATDVAVLAERLRGWRDAPLALDVERALAGKSGAGGRRAGVLAHLRERLFDLSRRNRLLYFRPTNATVNLTVASVPLVLQLESIRPQDICTWSGAFAGDVVAGKPVALQQWLRFEDQPYLPASLDQLLADTRRDRAEFGFSNLRLVVAFLRWHNLKEDPDERILTPLLWLPVDLVKRKGVRDQYVLQCADADAEFNPVLRHQLRQLYDIDLPEEIDLDTTTLAQVHADLLAQIRRSEPAVELRLIDKPAIRLVRQKALQRLQQYQRRKPPASRGGNAGLPPFSYARDDYRPLGQALFERWVRPSPLPQRFEAGAPPLPRQPRMAEAAEAREGFVLDEPEGHRYAWDIDLTQVTLANFNYKKMSLVRDYTQLLDAPGANPAFDRVFSIEPRAVDIAPSAPLALAERWNVVAADATQNAAVSLARSERSFIIQGPPGTGKSQTITNLIADYAGRGKRVLFVCEKRAALDVVFSRLRQSGLDSLCCLIHDSQTDKKAFIADLKSCYEAWIAQADEGQALQARRAALAAELEAHQGRIDDFETAMAEAPAALLTSVRTLLRRVAALPPPPDATPALRESLPELADWDDQRALAERLHRLLRERFGIDSLAAHAYACLAPTLVADEAAYRRVEHLCNEGEALFEKLDAVLEADDGPLGTATPLAAAQTNAAEAKQLREAGLAPHLDLFKPGSAARAGFEALRSELATREAALAEAVRATAHWRDKLPPNDTAAALALARELEPTLLRWLQPRWWRLRAELQRRYDFSQHAVRPDYRQVLEALTAEHAAAQALDAATADSRRRYGVSDMDGFLGALSALEARLDSGTGPRALVDYLRQSDDPVAAVALYADAAAPLAQLAALTAGTLDLDTGATLGDIAELLRDLREGLDELSDLLPLLRAVDAAEPACAQALRRLDYTPQQFDALISDEALRRCERASPVLQGFGGAALAQAARALAAGQRDLLTLNAQVVRATRHARFASNVRLSATSATQLDEAGKAFKKRYAGGRRELEHEFGKSMRHRAIRELSSGESGAVINDLKPVWLMSPLSVSDTLPLEADLFDVVIFDEASQIPVEESVPALSRARQVVVVGDEMQLPPTSFFASGAGAQDARDDIVVEEEGERIAIHLDSDSLLSQAARNLPATLLAWHYRSRHEALISFSNAAFYEGRLVTIPDQAIERAGEAAPPLPSSAPEAGGLAADRLLARPISYHLVEDGVYAERRNLPEARYIAQMVRKLLRRETPHSLGIVAFSEAQQGAIEAALDALASEDPDFGARLEREYVREDDDQFNGLFVKNLENVQGDERDVIILSICYGPGPDGKMLMNFGPINQRGGEKRLNVIFSRARHRMAVVSTIGAEAITNVHNDGAAALRAFLQFAQASSSGQFERAQSVLGALNEGAHGAFARQPGSDSIRDALALALRERGHEVHANVGRSQFRVDLAIVDPVRAGYALALLLDAPAETVTDSAERYVFRPAVLRSFGWRVLDLPGKDWLDDADGVLARIEAMLATGEDPAYDGRTAAPVRAEPAPPQTAPAAEADTVRTLVYQGGSAHKFWRASLRGAELTVSYGRVGIAGQSVVKTFDSPARAEREMHKLVEEKLRKGYTEP